MTELLYWLGFYIGGFIAFYFLIVVYEEFSFVEQILAALIWPVIVAVVCVLVISKPLWSKK